MPLVEAAWTMRSPEPCGTPRPIEPGAEKLAGSSMAWLGTEVPSGRRDWSEAEARVGPTAPTPSRLTVHAAERTPSGTSAAPFWNRDKRSEEHTSELQSLMRISYAVFCLKKKKKPTDSKT